MTDFEKELRRNATYHSGEGTAGYLLSEEQFKAITRAHEAAVAEIIGSDEEETYLSSYEMFGAHPEIGIEAVMSTPVKRPGNIKAMIRNELRASQRSRAKLPEEGAK